MLTYTHSLCAAVDEDHRWLRDMGPQDLEAAALQNIGRRANAGTDVQVSCQGVRIGVFSEKAVESGHEDSRKGVAGRPVWAAAPLRAMPCRSRSVPIRSCPLGIFTSKRPTARRVRSRLGFEPVAAHLLLVRCHRFRRAPSDVLRKPWGSSTWQRSRDRTDARGAPTTATTEARLPRRPGGLGRRRKAINHWIAIGTVERQTGGFLSYVSSLRMPILHSKRATLWLRLKSHDQHDFSKIHLKEIRDA
jgi:hypothetical protein